MPIIVNLDVIMAKRKIGLIELAEKINITPANLSILKNNKAKAIRFSTLRLSAIRYTGICKRIEIRGVFLWNVLRKILIYFLLYLLP